MKKLLVILGVFIFVSCQTGQKKNEAENEPANVQVAFVEDTINIGGMHCDMCVSSIEKGVNELEGIEFVEAKLSDSTVVVKYNATQTSDEEIGKAIEKRGYTVKSKL